MTAPRRSALNPLGSPRPYSVVPLFRMGERNVCPSCGTAQWFVGRTVATCARCNMPLCISMQNASPGSLHISQDEKEPA